MNSIYKELGHFKILKRLGRGGMGDVYLAEDTKKNSRRVALKLVPHGEDQSSREAIKAERRGAELQARLAAIDTHVAAVYSYGDLEDHFYVAMEYVDGEDLSSVIARGPLPATAAANIAVEMCLALHEAHKFCALIAGKEIEGIVHGDIKPQNVRIDLQKRVRLLDFGIAKALSMERRLTRNEFGSTGYASPERLDSGHVDQQSDLWSVGVLLYEMLSGRQPFTAGSTRKLEQLILSHPPAPRVPESCPRKLGEIVTKALSPKIGDRYRSASAMREALDAYLSSELRSSDDRKTKRTEPKEMRELPPREEELKPAPEPVWQPAPRPVPQPGPKPKHRRGRNLLLSLIVVGIALVGLSVIGLYMWNSHKACDSNDVVEISLSNIGELKSTLSKYEGQNVCLRIEYIVAPMYSINQMAIRNGNAEIRILCKNERCVGEVEEDKDTRRISGYFKVTRLADSNKIQLEPVEAN